MITEKLIRRHPHVFGSTKVKNVDEVWANWEKIKRAEKQGTHLERKSSFDGIPKHLPALLRAEKLVKKARKIFADDHQMGGKNSKQKFTKSALARELFELASFAQSCGWSAEELLCGEIQKRERELRRREKA